MPRGRRRSKDSALETVEDVSVAEEMIPAESEPEAEVLATPAPEAPLPVVIIEELAPQPVVVAEDKLVAIFPKVNQNCVMIGRKTYNLQKGVKLMVPANVRDHLKSKGKI